MSIEATLHRANGALTTLSNGRRQLNVTDLKVRVEHQEGRNDQGLAHYQLVRHVSIEGDLSDAERAKLLEIANKCPIHRIMEGDIEVQTHLV